MKIIFVCGGTSGHINPAINLANHIKEHDSWANILFVGSKTGMEVDLVGKAGFKFIGITTSGFSRKFNFSSILKNMISVKNIFVSLSEARKILSEFEPDLCIGTGGYVTGAFLTQSSIMRIPFLMHEQNAIPGFTTKLLASHAKYVLLGNKDAEESVKSDNCIYTGNPIKSGFESISQNDAKKELKIETDLPIILSFGGSLGSNFINSTILDVIKTGKYFHIHSCGKNNKKFYEMSNKMGFKNAIIEEYIYGIEKFMSAADIIICRAGAMTLSELAVMGKKAILIPSPNVANNHQFCNAKSYAKRFNSSVIEEKNLNTKNLMVEIEKLLAANTNIRKEKNEACEKIFEIIKKVYLGNTKC